VNFTNVLRAAFAPIFLPQKRKYLKRKYKNVATETFVQKSCTQNVGEFGHNVAISETFYVWHFCPKVSSDAFCT
jgi:hypothetical protein